MEVFSYTIGLNEKGGMDAVDFEHYISTNIVRLWPDATDIPRNHVMVKLDSVPGRTNDELNAHLQKMGFYLYPCVPNTTAVTQETDQSYGHFNNVFWDNLSQICSDRLENPKSMPFAPYPVGIFVFGGTDA